MLQSSKQHTDILRWVTFVAAAGVQNTKHKTILKTNEGTIQTEDVQIVYEYNEICGQINVDVLAYKQEAKNCVNLNFRTLLNKIKISQYSTQSSIEINKLILKTKYHLPSV